MPALSSFRERLFNTNQANFESFALEVFRWQVSENPLYRKFVSHLPIDPPDVKRLEDIPFIPVDFFKDHDIRTGDWRESLTFFSSGTTGSIQSKHRLDDPDFYRHNTRRIFESFYGPLARFHIVALLPSYLEREGSSLVFMADDFIKQSQSTHSGFFLRDDDSLLRTLDLLTKVDGKKLLLGVTFALTDLAERHQLDLSDFIVMETGGMKGRRREATRQEVHQLLREKLRVGVIHSEYGMTEMMSQAYSLGGGRFSPPPWLRVLIRDVNDPFTLVEEKKTGGVNILDLANLHSCCFLETKDLGRKTGNGEEFEVLGRFDNSDLRGCNLLIQ